MAVGAKEHALACLRPEPDQGPSVTGDLELLRLWIEVMKLQGAVASRITTEQALPTCLLHQDPLQGAPPLNARLDTALATPKPAIRPRDESRRTMFGAFHLSRLQALPTSLLR